MLLREGISPGPSPRLQVLEIGTMNWRRQESDLLPYLPRFRYLFAPLPRNPSEMQLNAVFVPLMDVECVTGTTVKVKGPVWYLKIKKGIDNQQIDLNKLRNLPEAIRFAEDELARYCADWTSPVWDELDWARVKELQVRDLLSERAKEATLAQSAESHRCPNFLKHVCMPALIGLR